MGVKYANTHPGTWRSGVYSDGSPRVPGYPELQGYESTFVPGLLGEKAVADYLGEEFDAALREHGQTGADIRHGNDRIEVKTTGTSSVLVKCETMSSETTRYVAAKQTSRGIITLLGWCFWFSSRNGWRRAPGKGDWTNFVYPHRDLFPMEWLL